MELPYDIKLGGFPFEALLNGDGFGTVGFSTSPGGEAELIVQVTNLGITTRRGGNRLVVFITSLRRRRSRGGGSGFPCPGGPGPAGGDNRSGGADLLSPG